MRAQEGSHDELMTSPSPPRRALPGRLSGGGGGVEAPVTVSSPSTLRPPLLC